MTNIILTVVGAGAASLIAWIIVIWKLDPFQSTGLALGLFFISLFVFLVSLFTLLGFFVRQYINKGEIFFVHFNVSLRQGILLAALSAVALFFLIIGVLRIWNAIILFIIVILLELYFEGKEE